MIRYRTFWLFIAIGFASVPVFGQNKDLNIVHRQSSKQKDDLSPEITKSINKVVAKVIKEQHIPGLAVVVVKNGKTRFLRGYGYADVEKRIKVDPDKTLFRIGSISKALTFFVLTRLIDDGRIERTDNVEKYFGKIENPRGFKKAVTIEHLLTHTGGFDQIGVGRHIYEHHLDLDKRKVQRPGIVEFLKANNLRRVNEPGQYFRYDTYGTTLAGAVIEKVTGKPFATAMAQEMFRQLGMKRSFVEVDKKHFGDLAIGYGWADNRFQPQPYEVYVTTPASSIDATPADMGRLLEALTGNGANSNGRLFSKTTNQKVLAPQFRSHKELVGITHGMFESYTSYDGQTNRHVRSVGHGGSMNGYRSAMTIIPDYQTGVFITANRAPEAGGGPIDFRPIIDAILESLPDLPKKKLHPMPEAVKVDLKEYTGDYYYGVFCHSMTAKDMAAGGWRRGRARSVSQRDGKLIIGDQTFLPRGKDVFVQSDGQRLAFFGREAGKITHFVYSSSPDTFERPSKKFPYRNIRSLAQRVYQLASSDGAKKAVEFFEKNKSSKDFYLMEQEMNNAGYALLRTDYASAAIEVFKLNVKQFPKSWNAFDSLAEAYATTGNKKLAIENYEKSIELNPRNDAGKATLKQLKKGD